MKDSDEDVVCSALERDGTNFAQLAVQCDQIGQIEMAIFYYTVSLQKL